MHGDGPADFAPDLDAVFARRNACDVDARSARALHDVLHDRGEMSVLHEVNASIPCDGGLKHHETTRGREAFNFRNSGLTRRAADRSHESIQLVSTTWEAVPFNDGPTPQEARVRAVEQWEKVGEVFKTVVWQIDQQRVGAATQSILVFPCSCVLADDLCWSERCVSFHRPAFEVRLQQFHG